MQITKEQIPLFCKHLKSYLSPKDVILLMGQLGAGKTTFTRHLLRAYDYRQGPVRSPTYSFMTLYPTIPPIVHADLYRLNPNEEIGLEEHLHQELCIIEWPEKLPYLLNEKKYWKIYFDMVNRNTRSIKVLPPEGNPYTEFSP